MNRERRRSRASWACAAAVAVLLGLATAALALTGTTSASVHFFASCRTGCAVGPTFKFKGQTGKGAKVSFRVKKVGKAYYLKGFTTTLEIPATCSQPGGLGYTVTAPSMKLAFHRGYRFSGSGQATYPNRPTVVVMVTGAFSPPRPGPTGLRDARGKVVASNVKCFVPPGQTV